MQKKVGCDLPGSVPARAAPAPPFPRAGHKSHELNRIKIELKSNSYRIHIELIGPAPAPRGGLWAGRVGPPAKHILNYPENI